MDDSRSVECASTFLELSGLLGPQSAAWPRAPGLNSLPSSQPPSAKRQPSMVHPPPPGTQPHDRCNGNRSPDSSSGNMQTSSSCAGVDVQHVLSAVDSEMGAGSDKGDPTERQLSVRLEDRELWSKFNEFTNEMIVTKNGRRMFPVFRSSVTGLDPSGMYTLLLDFVQVDSHRWKYVNGDWVPGGKAEPAVPNCVYIHPDSPNFGAHWMKEPVSFSKVKLTNKMNGGGQIMLNSLHKYEPRLHIIKVNHRNQKKTLLTYSFSETQFIAVTAYQNEEITALKIKYNPFAKAFLDAKDRPEQRDYGEDGACDGQARPLSHFAGTWYLPGVPPPAHQLPSHLLPNAGCDRLALRNARHTPYPAPYQRRSPPHGSNFPRDMGNLLNLPDNWATVPGMAPQGLLAGHNPGGMGQGVGPQYPGVWMPGNLANVSQSCAMPYLRPSPGTYSLPGPSMAPPSTAGSGLVAGLGAGGHAVGGAQPGCEPPFDLGAYGARDPNRSTWSPLTPPPL